MKRHKIFQIFSSNFKIIIKKHGDTLRVRLIGMSLPQHQLACRRAGEVDGADVELQDDCDAGNILYGLIPGLGIRSSIFRANRSFFAQK